MIATASSSQPVARSRLAWVDTARGIGIILVVYAHVLRGQVSAHLLAPTPVEQLQDAIIYKFHMPLFLMLSGLFVGNTARSKLAFLRRRAVSIVYPYILWSVLQTLASMMAQSHANKPGNLADLARIGWQPIGQFWFLYVLAIFQILLLLPRPLFYLMVPVGLFLSARYGSSNMLAFAGGALPFFAAGVWVTGRGLDRLISSIRRALLCLVGGTLCFLALLSVPPLSGLGSMLIGYVVATPAIIAVLGLSRLLGTKLRLLPLLGAASMAIFVLHVICAATARTLLVGLHVRQPEVEVLLVTLAGLLIPLILYETAIRTGLSPWLGLGYPPAPTPPTKESGSNGHPALERTAGKADVGADQARGPEFP